MEFEVPETHILRPTLFTDMVQRVLRWERQKRCSGTKRQGPIAKKYFYNRILMKFLFGEEKMKTIEDKRMVKLEFLSRFLFLDIYYKNQDIIFWCMVISLGPHSVTT